MKRIFASAIALAAMGALPAPARAHLPRLFLAGLSSPSFLKPVAMRNYRPVIKTIVIDPGHGGENTGSYRMVPGGSIRREKEVTLDIARHLRRELLQRTSARVFLTRTQDCRVYIRDRVGLANREKADLFISVHANSGELDALLSGLAERLIQNSETGFIKPSTFLEIGRAHV